MPAPVVHFEIGVRDSEKGKRFYGGLFGWEFQSYGGPAQMVGNIGPMAQPTATPGIGGHLNTLGHEPHHYCTVYVQVDDLEATLKNVERLGGKRLVPATEVPGMGSFAWFLDPDGTAIGLWKPAKK